MTPPKFLPALESLMERATNSCDAQIELQSFLANHAPAIAGLVRACDAAYVDSSRTRALSNIFAALAALNKTDRSQQEDKA